MSKRNATAMKTVVRYESTHFFKKKLQQCFCMVTNCDTGDDACKSYENLERDIKLLVDLNVEMYRFSLSWPRLMPDG